MVARAALPCRARHCVRLHRLACRAWPSAERRSSPRRGARGGTTSAGAWGSDELRLVSNTTMNWTQPALRRHAHRRHVDALGAGAARRVQGSGRSRRRVADPFEIAGGKFVDVFETTIRVLGGLVGAYSLSGDERLLDAAGDLRRCSRSSSLGVSIGNPVPGPRFSPGRGLYHPRPARPAGTAPAGTLLLEFRAVARLAGRPDLEELAMRSWQALGKATGRVKGLRPRSSR